MATCAREIVVPAPKRECDGVKSDVFTTICEPRRPCLLPYTWPRVYCQSSWSPVKNTSGRYATIPYARDSGYVRVASSYVRIENCRMSAALGSRTAAMRVRARRYLLSTELNQQFILWARFKIVLS